MLINHPTDGAMCFLCCLTLITRRRYVTMHCLSWNGSHMYFQVVFDRWRCSPDVEGGPLIRSYFIQNEPFFSHFFIFLFGLFAN